MLLTFLSEEKAAILVHQNISAEIGLNFHANNIISFGFVKSIMIIIETTGLTCQVVNSFLFRK